MNAPVVPRGANVAVIAAKAHATARKAMNANAAPGTRAARKSAAPIRSILKGAAAKV